MDPTTILALGAAGAALPLGLVSFKLWRALSASRKTQGEASAEVDKLKEILASSPDGLFVWDITNGRELCSRRLAVLLDLADGVDATYYDLRHVFEGESSASFDRAVGSLRRDGTPFDLLLPVGGRLLHVIGVRAGDGSGEPLADMLWMRDVDGIPGALAPAASQSEALTNAYDSFQYLLDALPIPVWLRDADLAVAFTNRACGGENLAAIAAPQANEAREKGQALTLSHEITRGGTPQELTITETPVKGWVGTAGFAMEPAMAAAAPVPTGDAALSAALEEAVHGLPTAVAAFGPDARLEFFNQAWATLWDLEPAWLAERPLLTDILDRKRTQRRLPEVADFRAYKEEQMGLFQSPRPRTERELHLPDGSTVRSAVLPRPDGGLVYVDEDVTGRLTLERDVATLEAVRRETLDNLHEGIAVFGGDGRLKLSNPKLLALWGLSGEAMPVGSHVSDFVESMRPLLAGIQDWDEHKAHVVASMMGRQPVKGRLGRRDGSVLDFANVPLPDGAVLTTYLDITDSAKVEMALRERAVALDEAGRLKSAFIANVSHEIRTPMNTIIGFAETLTQEYFGKLNRRQMEYGEGILDSAQGLMRVIGDILDLASIEAGMMSLELDTVDLHAMLVSVLGLVRERAKRHTLKLEFDCPTDIGWMVADERRLKQVVLNLLTNAVQFTPSRGTVLLAAKRDGEDLEIKVSDTGVGIPQAEQDGVFGAFHRSASPETGHAGAGLGLSIVRQFVELHGGTVTLKSAPGRGTTVTCRLPTGGMFGDEPVFPTAGLQ